MNVAHCNSGKYDCCHFDRVRNSELMLMFDVDASSANSHPYQFRSCGHVNDDGHAIFRSVRHAVMVDCHNYSY